MANKSIVFAGDKVALIVRGKTAAEHSPGKLDQHADCVRSNGAPVGYFGEDGEGFGYLTAAVLIGIRGEVYDMQGFEQKRPYYVNVNDARTQGVVSTALVIRVTKSQADSFDNYWDSLANNPGTFRLLGKNCSTRASGAFRHSGVLASGIPGLDTPDNLYKQLVQQRRDLCDSYSGYIGFEMMGTSMAMRVEGL